MNRKVIRNIILLGAISITGIVITQLYWINKAWDIKEKQFNHTVNIALRNVATELLMQRGDSASYIEPIRQVSANYFVVSINDTLHPYLLESLLKAELSSRNVFQDFEYGIYDCFTDSIVYGNYVSFDPKGSSRKSKTLLPVKWDKDGHYFGVYFPEKESYLISQMGIWVFSSVILLIVIIFFTYTIIVILKQKRLSEITRDFINNITHEFQTPISTISLSADVLMKPDISFNPERLGIYSKIISEENNRLKNMVERLLQMATLDKPGSNLIKKPLDVHSLINECLTRLNSALEGKGGEIKFAPEATNPVINADKVHLSNIIYNLLDNALKYSKGKHEITISTQNKKKGIEISVKDKGIGMSKEEIKNVFHKFYRVPTGNLHDVKGYGLGLSYVKHIVQAHKGKISVESEPGRGSCFKIYLPSHD
jgi:two-component system, OmpR family, phosphate regulon sensor histidine kinase PhoR